jgi:hypothetical protein
MKELLKLVRCKVGDRVFGPMMVSHLRTVPGFTLSCLVSPASKEAWEPAYKAIDLSAYFQRRTPVVKESIDSGLLSAVQYVDSDFHAKTVVVTGDPAFPTVNPERPVLLPNSASPEELLPKPERQIQPEPQPPFTLPERSPSTDSESSDKPGFLRRHLLAAMLVLISGGVYGAIHIATPLIRRSFFSHSVAIQRIPVQPLPVAQVPSSNLLDKAPAPVMSKPVVKALVHPRRHIPPARTRPRKHKRLAVSRAAPSDTSPNRFDYVWDDARGEYVQP